MKYYKIIKDSEIIGGISSDNFIAFQPITQCFLRSDELNGEYVSYNGSLYRDRWMKPIVWQAEFEQVQILEIDKETYDIIMSAIEHNEEIPIPDLPPVPDPQDEIKPSDVATLEFVRSSKLAQMSNECRMTIENGVDVQIHGETLHFSLSTQDQLNLMSLSAMAQTQDLIPYHADGEACIFYTSDEINEIMRVVNEFKIYHTTYYNALKSYINALNTIEEIDAITYGTPIPDEYKNDVLKMLDY